ncbi:hypothetical protein FA15DRAFT_603375 [Coprinopsis marcescibilis]|uniref:Cytochrome P450 n=1 Tax=Coprinopsis marcescibilis TaxID=230819 RepID=A0A5C3KE56_COPMA|nr:hypothetical protein FA15DRAFT_603375 [Coprinopsis marcescibilis]
MLCLIILLANQGKAIGHRRLAGISLLLSPKGACISEVLMARSRPNQRLVRAFGLTNTFVSPSTSIHRSFVASARTLLNEASSRGWEHFGDLASRAVHVELACPRSTGGFGAKIDYSIFVQCVTLRVILVGLLQGDGSVEDLARDDILTSANHINLLWQLSKSPNPIPSHLLPQLNASLRRMLPNLEAFPNPVDIVIPAWETFWRVVATAIAYSHVDPALRRLFSELYFSPTERVFKGFEQGNGSICVKNVIDEAMRLHPPSKHISRISRLRFPFKILPPSIIHLVDSAFPGAVYVQEHANIQATLLSPEIWGPDCEQFNPRRFALHDRPDQQEALSYIFGGGRTRCIGASWAPIAIGIVSSAILEELDTMKAKIEPGTSIGGRNGWAGWCIVSAENLILT